MSYPTTAPSYVVSDPAETLQHNHHAARHTQEEADIIALAAKLGIGTSTATSNTLLRGTGSGTTAFGQLNFSTDVATFASAALAAVLTDETGTGAVVFGTSPTITSATLSTPAISTPTITSGGSWAGSPTLSTPTIASFTNAQHDHSNAAGGGSTLNSPTIVTPTISQINQSSAPGVKLQLRTQTDNANTIASATTAGIYVQYGWGQVLGTGVSTLTDAVTFPTAFTTVLGVIINWIGFKSGGTAATDITGLNTAIGAGNLIQTMNITTSGFTMSAVSTGTFGAAYHGYSWIAWGI